MLMQKTKLKSLLPIDKGNKSPKFSEILKKYKSDGKYNIQVAGHSPNWQYFYIPIIEQANNWKNETIIVDEKKIKRLWIAIDNLKWPFVSNNWNYILSWRKGEDYSFASGLILKQYEGILIINWDKIDIKDFNTIEDAVYSNDWENLAFKYITKVKNKDLSFGKQAKYIRFNSHDILLRKEELNLTIWNVANDWFYLQDNWISKIRIFITKKFLLKFYVNIITKKIDTDFFTLQKLSSKTKISNCKIIWDNVKIDGKLYLTKVIFPNLDLNENI